MSIFSKYQISLSIYITIFVSVIIVALGTAMVSTIFFQVDAAIRQSQTQNIDREIEMIKAEIDSYLQLRRMVLLDYATTPLVTQTVMQPEQNMGNIQDAMDTWQIFQKREKVVLLDFSGEVIYANYKTPHDYAEAPWVYQIIDGDRAYYIDISSADGEFYWQIAVPVRYNNLPEGLLILEIPVNELYTQDQVFSRTKGMQLDLYRQDTRLASFGDIQSGWQKTADITKPDLPELRLELAIDQSEGDTVRRNLLFQILIVLIILSTVAGFVLLYFGRIYLATPIMNLRKLTTQMASGTGNKIVQPQTRQTISELVELQAHFYAMLHTIQNREQALQEAHDNLELRVQERTTELEQEIIWRRQVEKSLRESESRNRAMLDANPDLIFRLNSDGGILDYQVTDEKVLFVPASQLEDHTIHDALPKILAGNIQRQIDRVLETNEMQVFEYQLPLPDGLRTFEARLVAINKNEALGIVRDITERARLEQMKTDFINRASHELRTPLTIATMMVDLIQEGGDEEELQEYWQILGLELKRQKKLIEDLLTVGQLESGTMQLTLRPLDVARLLQETVSVIAPLAAEKQLHLHTTIPEHLSPVNGDERGLGQVFQNLLSNAVKFTPAKGEIRLQATPKQHGVSISISDSGIGIPAKDLPHLFERFFRAQNAIQDEIPGTGVGLYIIKSIVEELKGSITVQSQLNQGTTFEVWLPAG